MHPLFPLGQLRAGERVAPFGKVAVELFNGRRQEAFHLRGIDD